MENIIFSIFDGIELINKKLFYLVIPYGTKIINHIKENTLGSIMLIILIIVILISSRSISIWRKVLVRICYKK